MIPRTLSDFRGECRPSGDQINYKHCPICLSSSWKVFVDPDKGKWVCFGGRHPSPPNGGYPGGNLKIEGDDDAPGKHILDLLTPEDSVVEWGEVELPDWEPLSNMARRYLQLRGITPGMSTALGLVEWVDKHRILIPYFDDAGQLIYYTSRRYSECLGKGPKYLTAPGRHPLYQCVDLPRPMFLAKQEGEPFYEWYPWNCPVIVEGCFDAIAVQQAGYKGVALGGKSLPRYLESLLLTSVRGYGIIYILLDRDAMPQALRLRSLLTSKSGIKDVRVRFCPHNLDPGSMTPEEIREVLR